MNDQRLVDIFTQTFIAGDSFKTIIEARQVAATMLDNKVAPGTPQAKLVDEAVEQGLIRAARSIVQTLGNSHSAYDQLVDLYQRQPTLGTRSSTSVAQQAYSTPVPIAYLAASLAQITDQATVYEPTAGNGALLLRANPANATVNELNPARAADLRQQGYRVTEHDAAVYLPSQRHDVVILNPPFGSVTEAGRVKQFNTGRYRTTQIDHAIALNALKAMKDDGRAVLILGGKLGNDPATRSNRYNSRESRAFYFTLYNQYNVTQHLSIWGDLYRKQGAGFPIDLIVIEGRGQSQQPLPAAEVPSIYKSFAELKELLTDAVIFDQSQRLGSPELTTSQLDGSSSALGSTGDRNVRGLPKVAERSPGVADPPMAGGGTESSLPLQPDPGGHGPQWERLSSTQSSGLPPTVERSGDSVQPDPAEQNQLGTDSRVPRASPERHGGDRGQFEPDRRHPIRGVAERNQPRLVQPNQEREPMSDLNSIPPSEPEQPVLKQLPYTPKSQGQPVDTLIPVNMQAATTRALNTLEQQVGSIDAYVADRLGYGSSEELHNHFSAEQVDASALALSNLEKQSGFIIGDQTGVGKGRVVAAMIRYAKATGHTPIFVTQNPMLYADIMRDLRDIGLHDFKPFPTNSDLNIPLGTQQVLKTSKKTHDAELQSFIKSSSLGDYDGIFTTYSQMQSVRGKETLRRDFLRAFAANAILVMDESHVAGGTKLEWGQTNAVPNRAEFARELIERSAGVFYSSATYAKRPDVMDLYAKTDMRLAVKDIHSLVSMVETGGVPMQQALAAQLTEAGQYVRRERSYEGVSFNLEVVPVNREIAEQISATLAGILEFDRAKQVAIKELDKTLKAEAKAILGDNAVGQPGVESVNFTAVMHNLIDQTLLAMKAEATVQKALELLRQPDSQKPVIALSSIMGSFIGNYAQLHQIKPGDGISLDAGDLLKRYLERSRDIIVGNPYGEKSRQRLTDEQLGPVGVRQYEQVLAQINQTDFSSIPISPIDYIKARLSQSGYPVGEVTGRKDTIDYARDGSSTYEQRSVRETSKAAAIKTVLAFNNGDQDVIILNCSGSTGISLHASHQFQDQRQRHMIVVQPEKDINQFMQMLGRIHRTGQVVKPNFTLLNADIPAEKRPAAVLAKKMASLNANTTAARSSGISLDAVTDFMNEYGDRVVAEVLQNNPGLNRKLDYPLSELDTAQDSTPSLISRVTGRLPLLPLAEQEQVYTMIEREYDEYIQRQEAMGESMLEAQSLDLDARTIARMEVVPGDPGSQSPFTSPVYLEVVDAKALRKPMTTLEVMNLVREELGLKPVADPSEHDVEQVTVQGKQASAETRQTLVQAVEFYRAAAQAQTSSETGVQKLNTRLNAQLNHVGRTLDTFPVGEPVRAVTETGNIFYGVVGRVWHSAQEAGANPATPSTWKLQIFVADPARQLVLPLSQVNTDQPNAVRITPQTVNWDGVDIYDVFDQKQSRGREERQIFTGNLLRAYEKFNGKLINYTDNQGQTRQGLLTPEGFDIEESIEKQPVEIPTARQVIAFITEATQSKGQVKTLDETLTVKPQQQRAGDGFVLQTPKPKELGGRYYLDEALLRAAGSEFYSIGDRMECVVPKERIDAVLQRVMQENGVSLAAFEHRDTAREMLGIELPRLEQIQRGEFGAKGNFTPVVPNVNQQTRSRLEQVWESSFQPEMLTDQAKSQPSPLGPQTPVEPAPDTSSSNLRGESGLPNQATQAEAHSTAASRPLLENQFSSIDTPNRSATDSSQVAGVAPPEQQRGAAEKNVARLLEQAGLSEQVLQGEDFHSQIQNEPYIPLVIERHSNHLYLTHYRELNGDLCLDAEMVFQIGNTGALALKETAVADPNRGGEYRRCDRGFAQMFSQNLLHQGFAEAALQATNAATAEPQPQSGSQSVDPASTVRNSEADAPSPAPGQSAATEAQTTPAQLVQTDTAIERQPDDSKFPVSTVHTHTPAIPSEKEVSQLVAWQQIARALNRPDNYLSRISEITVAYQAGEPVSPEATSAMQGDLAAHERSLDQLRDWHRAARFLGHSDRYQQRITEVATSFKEGIPVSERAIQAMSQDLSVHQRKLEALGNWQKVARAIGQPQEYCAKIAKVVETCKAGYPLSDRAKIAMRQDLRNFQQVSGKAVVGHAVSKSDLEIGD